MVMEFFLNESPKFISMRNKLGSPGCDHTSVLSKPTKLEERSISKTNEMSHREYEGRP
jgi:hypothetical protein